MNEHALQTLLQQYQVGALLTRGILLVDDEAPNLAVLESFLDVDYLVYTAASGKEALAIAEITPLDVVIADQRMPGMTGTDLLAQLKEKRPDVLGIVLTGYSDTPALISAINNARAFRYLKKPWQPQDVLDAVAQASKMVFHQRAVSQLMTLLATRTDELAGALTSLHEAQKTMLHLDRLATAGRLAAGISHDLRNAMSGLLFIENEARGMGINADFLEAITVGLSGMRNLRDTLETMNQFVRQKRLSMTMEYFDPAQVVRDAVVVMRMDMNFRARQVDVSPQEGLPTLLGDRQKLVQVLVNLLRNAIQATEPGQRISLDVQARGGEVVYSVEDCGRGIPDELRQHLFEAFATTKEDGGIGLGLYMSQLIVAYHNGRIAALDRVGGGTRFEVALPPLMT